jgi:hypothetical protein
MKNVLKLFGIIALVTVIGFSIAACNEPKDDDDDKAGNGIESNYQGVYTVSGYYFQNQLLPWDTLTDPSYNSLKTSKPTIGILNPDSITLVGGELNGQTFPARTNKNALYVTVDGQEREIGNFISGNFIWTFELDHEGAYILYEGGKAIHFQGMPESFVDELDYLEIGLFPDFTTPDQALNKEGTVAYAKISGSGLFTKNGDTCSIFVPLYVYDTSHRWKGSGRYLIYHGFHYSNGKEERYERSYGAVNFFSAITNVTAMQPLQ